jgi:hypothetical protein
MCLTTTNIHNCGHEVPVDVDRCSSYKQSLVVIEYMQNPNASKDWVPSDDLVDLDSLLSSFRQSCARQSEATKKLRNYDCEACLARH